MIFSYMHLVSFVHIICMCLFVSVCVCVGMYVCEHVEARRQCEISSLITFSPYFLRQHLSMNLKLTDLDRLAVQLAPRIFLSLSPQPQDFRHI